MLPLLLGAVAAGAVIGLLPRGGSTLVSFGRTFAFAAMSALIALHLLPEAIIELGVAGLVVFGLAAAVPAACERVLSGTVKSSSVSYELGYVSLATHQLIDGMLVGTYAGLTEASAAPGGMHHGHADIGWAVAAHTVPLVSVVAIGARDRGGLPSALFRTGLLAVLTALGYTAAGSVDAHHLGAAVPWLSALVAGFLSHVVAGSLKGDRPRKVSIGVADAAVAGLGVALVAAGSGARDVLRGDDHRRSLASALLDLSLDSAPMLLLGLSAGAALSSFLPKPPSRQALGKTVLVDGARGALTGAPLSLGPCGVLPVAAKLSARRQSAPFVIAFLFSAPALGLETLALSARFFGWPFAAIRLVAAFGVAMAAAVAVGPFATRSTQPPKVKALEVPSNQRTLDVFFARLQERVSRIGPWMVLGLVLAAILEVSLAGDAFRTESLWLELAVVSALALPGYVCAASAMPLAAVLVAKGLSPGAALAALLLGPATNVAVIVFLRKAYGRRALVAVLASVVTTSWLLAWAVDAGGAVPVHTHALAEQHALSFPSALALAVLTLLAAGAILRGGIRGWFSTLSAPPSRRPLPHVPGT